MLKFNTQNYQMIKRREGTSIYFLKYTTTISSFIFTLHEKCPNMEFFLVRIFPHVDWICEDKEYLRMLENTYQKKLRIWTLVTQWQKGKESDDEESYDEKILESVIVPPPTTRARQRRNKTRKRNKNVNPKHVIN